MVENCNYCSKNNVFHHPKRILRLNDNRNSRERYLDLQQPWRGVGYS